MRFAMRFSSSLSARARITQTCTSERTSVVYSDGRVESLVTPRHSAITANLAARVVAYVLPTGFPASVAPCYARYAAFSSAGVVVSAAGGVMATQCMLYAVGMGAGALPLAAGLNWVLKDGLGQLGGVVSAALISSRFDADPKRWRFAAAALLDAASAMEIATAFYPPLFLPVAAAANVLKNVAWLATSASRASLHQSMAAAGNLADVTAKAGSQTIAGATAGTALGVALSAAIGAGPDALPSIAAAFGCLSLTNLVLVRASLQSVVLPSVSQSRLYLSCRAALHHHHRAPEPGPGSEAVSSGLAVAEGRGVRGRVETPAQVTPLERFLPHTRSALADAGLHVEVGPDAGRLSGLHAYARASGALEDGESGCGVGGGRAGAPPPSSRHIVVVSGSSGGGGSGGGRGGGEGAAERVSLLYVSGAGWRDVVMGHLHALRTAVLLRDAAAARAASSGSSGGSLARADEDDRVREGERLRAVREAAEWTRAEGPALVAELESAGWWVGQTLLEPDITRRVEIGGVESGGVASKE